jgi:hypothetical protein
MGIVRWKLHVLFQEKQRKNKLQSKLLTEQHLISSIQDLGLQYCKRLKFAKIKFFSGDN